MKLWKLDCAVCGIIFINWGKSDNSAQHALKDKLTFKFDDKCKNIRSFYLKAIVIITTGKLF